MSKALQASLEKGLIYLAQVQRPDGGFDSFSSPSKLHFKKTFTYQTTFVPAVMLGALSSLPGPATRQISRRLAEFVQSQRSPGGSFNYWAAGSAERATRPYPDDLDDTACALIGLFRFKPALIGPEVLAAFVKLLLATETRVGGPYRTWLVARDSEQQWSDVDVAVNANIAYFLSLVGQPLPNITTLMERAIRAKKLVSPYYVSPHMLAYYLARAYRGPLARQLQQLVQALRVEASQPTPLQNALLLSALVQLGADDVRQLAEHLLQAQQADGAWPAEAFCLDPARDSTTYYHGSEGLTTALALEALQMYEQAMGTAQKPEVKISTSTLQHDAAFRAKVSALYEDKWRLLKPELASSGLDFTRRIAKITINTEIVTLAKAFNESLVHPLTKLQEPALVQLSLANLYGWTAYTIYDDFLDEEGQPALLPVATAASRYCLEAFAAALPRDPTFQAFVQQTFDAIDGANAWELAHCRFKCQEQGLIIGNVPDYTDPVELAERSLGHSLTPLAVLRIKGIELESPLWQAVRQALVHYLAAKQLNDDAHDWQIDLQKGHITYVVTHLLRDARTKPGLHAWDTLLPLVREQFWYKTLPAICHDITRQTALSRHSLGHFSELKQTNILSRLLDSIDASVAETLAAQDQTQAFLRHYKDPLPAVS